MSFSISPGTSVDQMLQALRQEPPAPEPEPVVQPAKRVRLSGGRFKADDPVAPALES